MKFISDDGKKIGTQEEVLKYEAEMKAAEEKEKKMKEQAESEWKQIKVAVNRLNDQLSEYVKNSKEKIMVSVNFNGTISVTKNQDILKDFFNF